MKPLAGVSLRVTCVLGAKLALHVVPQLIPDGELATVPPPPLLTVRVKSRLNAQAAPV
jgi:hypothetical protein